MAETLDKIRAEIVYALSLARENLADSDRRVRCIEAELSSHDRAVAAMNAAPHTALAAREPCRDVAVLVLDALTDEWQTAAEIGEAIGVARERVDATLSRLIRDHVAVTEDGKRFSKV